MKKPGFLTRILRKALGMEFPRTGWGLYFLPRTNFDYQREVGDGTGSSVVMAVIFWIARRFAEAKYQIKRNGEVEEKHEVLSLLKKPNQFYSGRLLRMAAAVSYTLDGNVYFRKIRNKQLKPVELWYIPHWLIEPHYPDSNTEYMDYYSYRPNGIEQKILSEDIVHIRFGIDPNNVRKGMAPLKSLFREIFTDDEAANFSASLLRNMGVPGVMIGPGSENAVVRPKDKKAVKRAFKENFGGDRRGEPIVMSAKTDLKTFGFSPAEMDLSKLREIPEERVTAILGVPAAVVGFGTGLQQTKVGATMKELREAAYEDCIIPMQNLFADEINSQLIPDFEESLEDWEIDFDLSDIRVLQEDENAKSTRVQGQVKDCLITQGEGRAKLGYEVRPEHDVYLMPFNIMAVPAGSIGQTQPEPTNQQPPKRYLLPKIELKSDNWKTRLIRAFNENEKKLAAIFNRELQKVFDDLGNLAADIYERAVADQGIEILAAAKPEMKAEAIDELFGDLIVDGIDPQVLDYKRHYLRVAQNTFETINLITGLGVNLTDTVETEIVRLGGIHQGLIDLEQQTKDAVFKALAEAREAGEGPYEAALRIRDQVAAGPWTSSKIRANIIARTETKYAQQKSSIQAYKSGGVNDVEIVDGQLPTSDEFCIARNGKIISIEEADTLDDHPNNTLSFTPVIGNIGEG